MDGRPAMIGRLRFLGVMDAAAATMAAAAPWGREAGLRVFVHDDLAAVFIPGRRDGGPIARLSLRPPLPDHARIEILRRLSLGGSILPAGPAAALGPLDAAPALAANAGFLRDALARMAGRVQRRVIIAWDRAETLRRHANDPELTVAMGACADRAAQISAENQGLAILRERLATLYALQFMAVCEDALPGTPASVDVVLDMLCLIEPAMGLAFEATAEAIGDAWPEGLTIIVGGPAPATGFVALDFEAPADAALDAAALALGVGDPRATSPEAVDAAFRARAGGLRLHPGGPEPESAQVDALRASAALLLRAAAARGAVRAAGLPDDAPVMLAVLRPGEADAGGEAFKGVGTR
jgi:hypothetical protein